MDPLLTTLPNATQRRHNDPVVSGTANISSTDKFISLLVSFPPELERERERERLELERERERGRQTKIMSLKSALASFLRGPVGPQLTHRQNANLCHKRRMIVGTDILRGHIRV